MNVWDMHCDTAYEMYKQKVSFNSDNLNLSYGKIKQFDHYHAVFAFWCDSKMTDDKCFRQFFKSRDYFLRDIESYPKKKISYTLAVEDARLLAGFIERLSALYTCGVRFITAVWKGNSCIGGAYDTKNGLTEFGKDVIGKCFEIGIVPDVSHASQETFCDIVSIAKKYKKPIVATHSDSYTVSKHDRNITDCQFRTIKQLCGLVGISMASEHVRCNGTAKTSDVIAHIDHYMALGGEDIICLGCDYDGIESAPVGLENAGKLYVLAEALAKENYTDRQIDKIFYLNAKKFFYKNNIYT